MEPVSLALAVPPILIGLGQCILHIRRVRHSLGNRFNELNGLLFKCEILKSVLASLQTVQTDCLSFEVLETLKTYCLTSINNATHFIGRIDGQNCSAIQWLLQENEFKAILRSLDDCRNTAHICLTVAQW